MSSKNWNPDIPHHQKFHTSGTCIPLLSQLMKLQLKLYNKIFHIDPSYNIIFFKYLNNIFIKEKKKNQ